MQKSIFAASLLLAGVAFADTSVVETEYVLGVMPVNATGKTEVILSIPWVAEGSGENIAVSNLVKTAGLKAEHNGDTTLRWYDTSTGDYKIWNLKSRSGTNYWEEASGMSDAARELSRGDAVLLSTTNGTLSTVYVVGQVGSTASVETTIANSSDGVAPAYTLLAPPTADKVDLNDDISFTGDIDSKDYIVTEVLNGGLQTKFVRNDGNTKWVSVWGGDVAGVPAGKGFWYVRYGTGTLRVSWSAPSAN